MPSLTEEDVTVLSRLIGLEVPQADLLEVALRLSVRIDALDAVDLGVDLGSVDASPLGALVVDRDR